MKGFPIFIYKLIIVLLNLFQKHGYVQRLDPTLSEKIDSLVSQGIHDLKSIKLHLDGLVRDIFKDRKFPSRCNRRYFPTMDTIRNHMVKSMWKLKHSTNDEQNLESLIESWKDKEKKDKFSFRKKSSKDKFLYVHQTEEQRHLLKRYGSMVLLDATYKTTKYALPLFFLVVKTNCGYHIVASFVIENEDSTSIDEALRVVKDWNPEWLPKYFMTDFDSAEISALEQVFQGKYNNKCILCIVDNLLF